MRDRPIEILMVEDNADDEQMTLHALRNNKLANGIQVVRDGEEAIEFLSRSGRYASVETESQLPKLILLDIKLPKVSGIEVLKFIRATPALKRIPVVMLTSSREERDIFQSYDLGANSYIVKPVTFEQFAESVRMIGMYWVLLNQPPGPSNQSAGIGEDK